MGSIQTLHSQYQQVYITYQFEYDKPWKLLSNTSSGVTQIAKRSSTMEGHQQNFNHLFQASFVKETKDPQGWPQIIFIAYERSLNNVGENLIGYGVMQVPIGSGEYKDKVYFFKPRGNLTAGPLNVRNPEFANPGLLSTTSNRQSIETISEGIWLDVDINVILM